MTMPVITCLLVGALCCAICGFLTPALVIVGFCALLEFFIPGQIATEPPVVSDEQ